MREFADFFAHVHVISLKRRPDRLRAFYLKLERHGWPFKWPEVFHGIDGDIVGCPPDFTHGRGAFGCRESHCCILREHLMNQEEGWVLVLEDDADVNAGFADQMKHFLELVEQHTPHANGLMLGGEHRIAPDLIAPGILKVKEAHRTHAYACRRHYLRALYHRWSTSVAHIDWRMTNWQVNQRVYAPQSWIVGQAGGPSDITGEVKPTECWNPPGSAAQLARMDINGDAAIDRAELVLLTAPREVTEELRRFGFHSGYWRGHDGIDNGLRQIFALPKSEHPEKLKDWVAAVGHEAKSIGGVVTVWHPAANVRAFEGVCDRVVEINAINTVEALKQWQRITGNDVPVNGIATKMHEKFGANQDSNLH